MCTKRTPFRCGLIRENLYQYEICEGWRERKEKSEGRVEKSWEEAKQRAGVTIYLRERGTATRRNIYEMGVFLVGITRASSFKDRYIERVGGLVMEKFSI